MARPKKLFEPKRLSSIDLKNRLAMLLVEELKKSGATLLAIGDCSGTGTIHEAMRDGFLVGSEI